MRHSASKTPCAHRANPLKISARAVLYAASLATTALVSGCGVTYRSPTVQSQAAGLDVSVVPLTASSVKRANSHPYVPQALPGAFYAVAQGSGLRNAGSFPTAPIAPTAPALNVQASVPPKVTAQAYKLGVGDRVAVVSKGTGTTLANFGGLPGTQTQRQGFTLRGNGTISLPDVGQVRIAGKTLEDAEAALFQAFVDQKIDPAFSLEVIEFNAHKVAIGGKVARAGQVAISLKPLRLGDALAAAGGVTASDPGSANIQLYRDGKLYQFPAAHLRSKSDIRNMILISGDAIFVNEGYDHEKAMAFYEQQIDAQGLKRSARLSALSALEAEMTIQRGQLDEQRSNFATRTTLGEDSRDYVYLAGEVRKQGRSALPYGRHASLADVLFAEGGFDTKTGNPAQIYVIRSDPGTQNTSVTAWHLDATNAVNITLATRMQMRPNDIVFIEEQPITKWSRAFEQAFPILINKWVDGNNTP